MGRGCVTEAACGVAHTDTPGAVTMINGFIISMMAVNPLVKVQLNIVNPSVGWLAAATLPCRDLWDVLEWCAVHFP